MDVEGVCMTKFPQKNVLDIVFEPRHEKTGFCICENKDADQLRGFLTMRLIWLKTEQLACLADMFETKLLNLRVGNGIPQLK